MSLITTWPRRLALAFALFVLTFGLAVLWAYHTDTNAAQPWTTTDMMTRLFAVPATLAAGLLAATTLLGGSRAVAAPAVAPAPAEEAKPFMAQVVGLQWLNPLHRRDYPTEWETLWALGIAKPNKNDELVKEDPDSFTTIKPVSIIGSALGGDAIYNLYQRYGVNKLVQLYFDRYFMDGGYFYNTHSKNPKDWRELAGIHIEYAIPSKLDAVAESAYVSKAVASMFSIGKPNLSSRNDPPVVHATQGGPNAGFTSLNAALDYLQANPTQTVWVLTWDAPSFPKDGQLNENVALLILAHPSYDTQREPLAWIGHVASSDTKAFEATPGAPRAVQAWQATLDKASAAVGKQPKDVAYIIHDANHGGDVAGKRLASLSQALTMEIPEFDFNKHLFNTPALLGDMGAATAVTNLVLAIGYAHHMNGNVLVAGTTDDEHPTAVMVLPPAKARPYNPEKNWFRAGGEGNAYLPWWGLRRDTDWSKYSQGYSD